MKLIVALLILLALIGGIRYVNNKPNPVDQNLIAQIQDKVNEMEDENTSTGMIASNTGGTTTWSAPQNQIPISGDTYIVTSGSTLGWIGRKVWGEHTGMIVVKNATAIVADNKLIWGEILIDMNGLTVSDLPAWDMNEKLVWHLKSGFFDVANYPEAKFVITAVNPTATGNDIVWDLTLKGITKSISFPATITTDASTLKVWATTYIDKEMFGITEWAGMVDKLFGLVFDLTFTK